MPVAPTSWVVHGLGSGPGGVPPPPPLTGPTAIESYTAVAIALVLWLVVATPTLTFAFIEMPVVPIAVHVAPSGDTKPVNVVPVRVSLIHAGADWLVDPTTELPCPPLDRAIMDALPPGEIDTSTWRDPVVIDSRI